MTTRDAYRQWYYSHLREFAEQLRVYESVAEATVFMCGQMRLAFPELTIIGGQFIEADNPLTMHKLCWCVTPGGEIIDFSACTGMEGMYVKHRVVTNEVLDRIEHTT